MQELRTKEGLAARALEFGILTAARTGEVIGARWKEVDLDGGVWTVPAERMKGKRQHRKPLPPGALALLETLAVLGREGEAFIFPGPKPSAHLSNMAMAMLIRGMCGNEKGGCPRWADAQGEAITAHGFRRTFRDWAGETGQPVDLAEAALAHVVRDKTEAAYARSDLFARRRHLMEMWGTWCATPTLPANVSRLRRTRGSD